MPNFKPFRMNVIAHRLHAGGETLGVGDDVALRVAIHLPAIVDHDVLIAGILHAARNHGVGGLLDQVLAHIAGELVPTVPAHGRGARQSIVERLQFTGCNEAAESRDP